MTFLNGIMLLGLAAVAIPVIIHILNRRRAQVVDWGAMQFLAESLASRSRRILLEDILLMLLRCLVLALLAFALARPFLKTGRLLAGAADDAQDVAIVLDGSLSMTLDPDGKSNFQRALDEAHQVVQACRSGDAVSVILAGPTAQPVVASPVSDRQDVHDALDELTAPGGSMGVLEGLHAATLSLAAGANPAKKVVLITDAQALGWDLSARQRWQFLSEATGSLATPPTVIVRALEAPREWANACAAALSFSRAIIGTDRPVKVTATVANTGTGTIAPEAVELRVDGALVDSRKIAPVAAGASSSAIFEPRFELPGPHVVSMRVVGEDDLPGDNETARVVDVLRTLPVLILQGTSSPTPLKSDGDFLKVAMVPPPGEQTPGEAPEHLIRPTVVAAADVGAVKDFSAYKVVVLANVPRLPSAVAGRLARFVADGGGLLVAPGGKADKGFYNDWSTPDGKGLLGCRLVEIREDAAGPDADEASARIAVNTLDHPAMRLLSDPAGSDLSAVRIRRHWVLAADAGDESVGIGAALDGGDACLVQRKLGRGFVLTLALPMDAEFSDLPRNPCGCFPAMVHELVYYLAAPSQRPMNLLPGQQFVYEVPGRVRSGDVAEVIGPDGRRMRAKLQQLRQRWVATYALTARPGLYRLALPDAALGELSTRPAVAGEDGRCRGVPFLVLADPEESTLELLADDDFRRAGQFLHLARAETLSELTAAIQGGVPGSEIWRPLALLLLALVVLEIVATRWIAVRRKAHLATPVAFGSDQLDVEGFRAAPDRDGTRAARPREVSVR